MRTPNNMMTVYFIINICAYFNILFRSLEVIPGFFSIKNLLRKTIVILDRN